MRTVVVLPTFNEAENIIGFLQAVRTSMPDADILVVDDNSPDGTAALAEETAAELGRIKVLRRAGKQGLGAAYRHGFTVAFDEGYEAVVSMDSDFSHDPAVIPAMVILIEAGADAVIGSRYVPGGSTVDWPMRRRLLSRWGNRYTAAVLRLPVSDCTSGFRAYR
ncbi:MAG TPA: glycosyltransferase, partial [Ilumatobacteraceae bacterium]